MKMKMTAALIATLMLPCAPAAQAYTPTTYKELKEIAASFVAFELHKDKCKFEPVIHEKFSEIDAHLSETYPSRWKQAKADQKYEVPAMGNMGWKDALAPKTPGIAPECGYAVTLMSLLGLSMYAFADPQFAAALQRLSAGGSQ
jgi:hypothetical protein